MDLRINGEPRSIALETPTIEGLLGALGVKSAQVAVELNGTIVKKSAHPAQTLSDGDVVEVVTLVGGG